MGGRARRSQASHALLWRSLRLCAIEPAAGQSLAAFRLRTLSSARTHHYSHPTRFPRTSSDSQPVAMGALPTCSVKCCSESFRSENATAHKKSRQNYAMIWSEESATALPFNSTNSRTYNLTRFPLHAACKQVVQKRERCYC
jgi:hypothetical protein